MEVIGRSQAHSVTTVTELPDCDICKSRGKKHPAKYDGRTKMGPWAYMCPDCFVFNGVGLGIGRGQRLEVGAV